MKKRTTGLLWMATTVILLLSAGYLALQHSRTQIQTAINVSLQEAERIHYHERLAAFQADTRIYVDPVIKAYLLAPVSQRKIKSYTLQTTEKETTYLFKDSIPEKTARKLLNEYLLADIRPVNTERLNQLFQAQLAQRHISGLAGVFYSNKQTHTKTRAGILPTASAYRTPIYPLDLTHHLQLQGWADYDLLTELRYVHAVFYALLCLILAGGLFFYKQLKKRPHRPEKGLYIDLAHQMLTIDGIQCAISRLDLQILHLLWKKEKQCVNRDEIKAFCWPQDAQADEKLDTHIQIIRKVLQDFPDYRIVTVKGRGYYLMCSPTANSTQPDSN